MVHTASGLLVNLKVPVPKPCMGHMGDRVGGGGGVD